jgi:hypothetical protein
MDFEKIFEKFKRELKCMKHNVDDCINTDYVTGYLSAINTIEGGISQLSDDGDIEKGEGI